MTSAAIAAAGAVTAGLSGGQQTFGADGQPLQGSLATLVSTASVGACTSQPTHVACPCLLSQECAPNHACIVLFAPDIELWLLQGAQAHAAGVLFPSDDDTLHRTILIANINPLVNTEQVR